MVSAWWSSVIDTFGTLLPILGGFLWFLGGVAFTAWLFYKLAEEYHFLAAVAAGFFVLLVIFSLGIGTINYLTGQ